MIIHLWAYYFQWYAQRMSYASINLFLEWLNWCKIFSLWFYLHKTTEDTHSVCPQLCRSWWILTWLSIYELIISNDMLKECHILASIYSWNDWTDARYSLYDSTCTIQLRTHTVCVLCVCVLGWVEESRYQHDYPSMSLLFPMICSKNVIC